MASKTVTIVGLGYVGLPVAVLAKEKGWAVFGYDTVEAKVAAINQQVSPVPEVASDAELALHPIVASTNPGVVADADVIVITVPTPVHEDNLPDLRPLKSALTSILPFLKAGQLLVVESTINPGVMDEVVVPLLRTRTDLHLDADATDDANFFLVHCPERVNPGDARWTVRNIPRVLGGYSPDGTRRAVVFYESVLEAPVQVMASVTEAEAVKIFENTFRDVNIAFVNEMAKSFAKLNIDVTRVIKGAATKPFGFMPHYPGNGVGGHCISVDPYYMIERGRQAGFDHEFLKLARQINDSMPAFTVELLELGLAVAKIPAAEARVALLGLAYKKNVGDLRESPALTVRQLLQDGGFHTEVYDPHVARHSTVASLDGALAGANVVMLACDHTALVEALTPARLAAEGIRVVIDGKNALDGDALAAAGIVYYGVGRARLPKTVGEPAPHTAVQPAAA